MLKRNQVQKQGSKLFALLSGALTNIYDVTNKVINRDIGITKDGIFYKVDVVGLEDYYFYNYDFASFAKILSLSKKKKSFSEYLKKTRLLEKYVIDMNNYKQSMSVKKDITNYCILRIVTLRTLLSF
jgi:hypothetical protein